MNSQQRDRARNCIMGAVVADAASMGFHWLYSQRRISELAPDEPEFRAPDENDYADGAGYFAHAQKSVGDLSQYGEQMMVMLHSLVQTEGSYQKAHYTEQFRRHFGYGGEFVGYIDSPTRQTLDRIYRDEHAALEAVDAVTYEGDQREQHAMLTKVLAAAKQYEGQGFRERVEWYADAMPDPARSRTYGLALVDALAAKDDFPGAIDEQLPAVSKLPPLVACHIDDPELPTITESAIRVTNNAPRAVDFGRVCTELLKTSIQGASIGEAIEAAVAAGSDATRERLTSALAMDGSVRKATREFGLHCDLGAGIPSVMHNLQSTTSFTEAIRRNILAGGDNCGRAIVLGAVCGAQFGMGGEAGIPLAWVNRLSKGEAIQAQIDRLFAPD